MRYGIPNIFSRREAVLHVRYPFRRNNALSVKKVLSGMNTCWEWYQETIHNIDCASLSLGALAPALPLLGTHGTLNFSEPCIWIHVTHPFCCDKCRTDFWGDRNIRCWMSLTKCGVTTLGLPLRCLSSTESVSRNRRTSWYSVFTWRQNIGIFAQPQFHTPLIRVTLRVRFQPSKSVTAWVYSLSTTDYLVLSTNWPSTRFPKPTKWSCHLYGLLKSPTRLPTLFSIKHGIKTGLLAKWQNINLWVLGLLGHTVYALF
jgi:hypothetical protein